MGKRYWHSLLDSMGLLAIIYLASSLIWRDALDLRDMQEGAAICVLIHAIAFFTFDLKLFSKRLWVRRAIVIISALIILIGGNLLFQEISPKLILTLCVCAGVVVIGAILGYYITDKIEERRLEAINKILEQNQKDSPSEKAPNEDG